MIPPFSRTKPLTWVDKAEHVALALLITGALGWLTANPWIGAAAAIGVFYGREERDDEVRQKARMPLWRPWRSLLPIYWSLDGFLDFSLPTAAAIAMASAAALI